MKKIRLTVYAIQTVLLCGAISIGLDNESFPIPNGYRAEDECTLIWFLIVTLILSTYAWIRLDTESWISLYIKRKILQEKTRIKSLEGDQSE